MPAQPKQTRCIQVKPPISDAVPPFKTARQAYALSETQQQKVMEMLGTAIYECRQKKKVKARAMLSALPKGYIMEYGSSSYKFIGHPSNSRFDSTNTFLEHLLWLEAMSHPESIEPRRVCKCVVCTHVRNRGKSKQETEIQDDSSDVVASSSAEAHSEPASQEPAAALPTTSPASSRESTPADGDPKTIRIYPLKRVLIERHATPHYYYPDEFTIPLPKIHKSDESILSKSLR